MAVVVAASEIKAGTAVDAGALAVIDIPAGAQVASVMVPAEQLSELAGQVATRSIQPSEPILISDLRPAVDESGRRAMSFSLPSSNAVGGDLAAGDVVDVLVVTDEWTRFVAEGVPVVAVPDGASTGLVAGTGSWWVTLAVEDHDALEIADGVERGSVYLLRSTGTPALTVTELSIPSENDGPAEALESG